MAAFALTLSIASLLLGVGNARRLNSLAAGRPDLMRLEALAVGERLPPAVREALAQEPGAINGRDRFLLVVATGTCPACRTLAVDLNHRHVEFSQLPLVVVDSGEVGAPEFREWLDFPVSIVRDEHQVLQSAMKAYAVPFSFLIADERILGHTVGDSLGSLLDGHETTRALT